MQVEAGAVVTAAAQNFGSRVALTAGPRQLTFSELNELANRVGSALADLGVARGDRVGVPAYNTPEVVATWFGCEKHNLVRTKVQRQALRERLQAEQLQAEEEPGERG